MSMSTIAAWLRGLPIAAVMACAQAVCPVDRPIQAGTYEYGINYKPQTHSGLDLDLLDELQQRTGCQFVPVYDSRVRLWEQFTDGKLDMMASVLMTPDREQMARFIIHSYVRTVVLIRPRPDFPATPEAFLANHRLLIGTVNSYRYSPGADEWVNALRAQHRTYEAPDVATLLKVFDAGRVAAIPVGAEARALIAQQSATEPPMQRLDWFKDHPKAADGLALSRQRLPDALADRFQEVIDQMRTDGTLLRIAEKYFDHDTAVDYISSD